MRGLMSFSTEHEDYDVGEVKQTITYDYLIELYEDIKKTSTTEQELQNRVAVLKVLSDHIGEHMIVKYKQ